MHEASTQQVFREVPKPVIEYRQRIQEVNSRLQETQVVPTIDARLLPADAAVTTVQAEPVFEQVLPPVRTYAGVPKVTQRLISQSSGQAQEACIQAYASPVHSGLLLPPSTRSDNVATPWLVPSGPVSLTTSPSAQRLIPESSRQGQEACIQAYASPVHSGLLPPPSTRSENVATPWFAAPGPGARTTSPFPNTAQRLTAESGSQGQEACIQLYASPAVTPWLAPSGPASRTTSPFPNTARLVGRAPDPVVLHSSRSQPCFVSEGPEQFAVAQPTNMVFQQPLA